MLKWTTHPLKQMKSYFEIFLWLGIGMGIVSPTSEARETEGAALFETKFERLFSIRRSTNENELVYEVRIQPDGFDTRDPVYVYWIMKTKGGVVELLSALERSWAYGVNVKQVTKENLVFSLNAMEGREITVVRSEPIKAVLSINGEGAALNEIFIQTRGKGLIPKIDFIELRGSALDSGKELVERVSGN